MRKIFTLAFALITVSVYSQGFLTSKNINVELSGFIRNDFIFDSRKNIDACDHLIELFPDTKVFDSNGDDINAQPSIHLLNTFSRFGTKLSGLEMGKAKISAYAEIDFTGGSLTPTLRLRHAYTQIHWEKSNLIIGRNWHPLFIDKVYPTTLNENTGLPFQVFNRSPQLKFTRNISENVDLITAAIYQYDFSNQGPNGKTYQYQRNALIPNLHAQLQYFNAHWVLGAAFDWKIIQPRTSTEGLNGTFKTNEKLSTIAAIAYLKYANERFEFKAKTMYGQNVCESLLPSGYAVASLDAATGAETYTPFNHVYNWINIIYGGDWKGSFFAGYLKNFGTSENITGPIYGFASNADMMYKLSSQLFYNYKNFMFGVELSLTTVAYGENDYNNKGKVENTENVTNLRNMIAIAYKF
ncbi:MAG: hypothetical protein JXR61_12745 [Prolixibacteraceae bacterium]|nr:hypothetical protein [Prolixibacteraceae bacterium]